MQLKTQLKILAALMVAAMFAFAFVSVADEASAEERVNESELAVLLATGASDAGETITITGNIDKSVVIDSGDTAIVKGNVALARGVTITVNSDATLKFEPIMESTDTNTTGVVSIKGAENSGFIMKEGSVMGGYAVPADLTILFNGFVSMSITMPNSMTDLSNISLQGEFFVQDKTVISFNEAKIKFNEDLKATADIKVGIVTDNLFETLGYIMSGDLVKVNASGEVVVNMTMGDIDFISGDETANLKYDKYEANIKFSTPLNNGTDKISLVIKETTHGKIVFDTMVVELSGNTDLDLGLTNVTTEVGAAYPYISGSVKSSIVFDGQVNDGQVVIDDVKFESSLDIVNNVATGKVITSAKKISAEYESVMLDVENASYSAKVSMDISEILKELTIADIIEIITNLPDIMPVTYSAGPIAFGDLFAEENLLATNRPFLADENDLKKYATKAVDILEELKFTAEVESKVGEINFTNDHQSFYLRDSDSKIAVTFDGNFKLTVDDRTGFIQAMTGSDGMYYRAVASDIDFKGEMNDPYAKSVTIKATADSFTVDLFFNGQLRCSEIMTNITGELLISTEWEIPYRFENASCDYMVIADNLIIDFGKVTYDDTEGTLVAEKATVSGNYAGPNKDLKSVNGTISNLTVPLIGSIDYESSDLTFTMKNGDSINVKSEIRGDHIDVIYDVKGTIDYYDVTDDVYFFVLFNSDAPEPDRVTVIGDGKLVSDYYDGLEMELVSGKLYITEGVCNSDYDVNLILNGVYLVIDNDLEHMKLAAKDGYTLDPTSYSGFTIGLDGYIIFTEYPRFVIASGIGSEYTLTLNGTSQKVTMGQDLLIQVPKSTMWVADENGEIYGYALDGKWYYTYDVAGDLEVKSVSGVEVNAVPGETVKANAESAFFENVDDFEVELSNGLIVLPSDFMYEDYVMVFTEATNYNGKSAYNIESNTNVEMMFPVSDRGQTVYHVINDVPLEMAGEYVEIDGQLYLKTTLTSYSLYYVSEGPVIPGNNDNTMLMILTIVVIIVAVLAVLGYLHVKHKSA